MNISNLMKNLTFGCMLSTVCIASQATAFYGNDCCYPTTCCQQDPCCTPCCDGPLTPSSFGIAVKGGVTPAWFTDRGRILFTDVETISDILVLPVVVQGPKEPDFDKFFNLPWQVGAEIQWNASCNVQFFAEYVFLSAEGKKRHFFLDDNELFSFRNHFKNFETNGVYLGARYYFGNVWSSECGTSSIAPFFGFKGGVVWHEKTRSRNNVFFADLDIDFPLDRNDAFKNQTLISAGVQIGLDWSINCNWGVVLTVEAVGTQSLRSNRNFFVPELATVPGGPVFPATIISRGETGHILSVPVTLGVRYTF